MDLIKPTNYIKESKHIIKLVYFLLGEVMVTSSSSLSSSRTTVVGLLCISLEAMESLSPMVTWWALR